jgi:hypothetical protein
LRPAAGRARCRDWGWHWRMPRRTGEVSQPQSPDSDGHAVRQPADFKTSMHFSSDVIPCHLWVPLKKVRARARRQSTHGMQAIGAGDHMNAAASEARQVISTADHAALPQHASPEVRTITSIHQRP